MEIKFGPESDYQRRTIYVSPKENVRTTAFLHWEKAGKPEGKGFDFWLEAERLHSTEVVIPDEDYRGIVDKLIEHGSGEFLFQDNCIADIKKHGTKAERARKIIRAAKSNVVDNIYNDMKGLASKAYPELIEEEGLLKVADFILDYRHLWHDVGNQDPIRRKELFAQMEPLYLDLEHNHLNPKITERDYLAVFKEFERRWALGENESSSEANWLKAQIGLAAFIKDYIKGKEFLENQPTSG